MYETKLRIIAFKRNDDVTQKHILSFTTTPSQHAAPTGVESTGKSNICPGPSPMLRTATMIWIIWKGLKNELMAERPELQRHEVTHSQSCSYTWLQQPRLQTPAVAPVGTESWLSGTAKTTHKHERGHSPTADSHDWRCWNTNTHSKNTSTV